MGLSKVIVQSTILLLLLADSKTISGLTKAEVCVQILRDSKLYPGLWQNPARIRKWDVKKKEFVLFEAFKMNGTLICSVDYNDNIAGKNIHVSISPVSYLLFIFFTCIYYII